MREAVAAAASSPSTKTVKRAQKRRVVQGAEQHTHHRQYRTHTVPRMHHVCGTAEQIDAWSWTDQSVDQHAKIQIRYGGVVYSCSEYETMMVVDYDHHTRAAVTL